MGKIRTVKPELFRHEKLFEAEQLSGFPLRFIFIGLFTITDAEGRFRWRPRQLKLDILPYDEINFSAALSALADFGFIVRYEHEGEYYGYIPTWQKHQSINQREPDSVLPDPQRGFIFKPPAAHVADIFSLRGSDLIVPASSRHNSESTAAAPSSQSDLGVTLPSSETHATSSIFVSKPDTANSALSVAAEPRTVFHVQSPVTHMHNSEPYPMHTFYCAKSHPSY